MAGRVCVRREAEHLGYHMDQRGSLEDAKKLDIQIKLLNIAGMVHGNLGKEIRHTVRRNNKSTRYLR